MLLEQSSGQEGIGLFPLNPMYLYLRPASFSLCPSNQNVAATHNLTMALLDTQIWKVNEYLGKRIQPFQFIMDIELNMPWINSELSSLYSHNIYIESLIWSEANLMWIYRTLNECGYFFAYLALCWIFWSWCLIKPPHLFLKLDNCLKQSANQQILLYWIHFHRL